MSDYEYKEYEDPFYIGEDRDIECEVEERDDTAFTIASGTFALYDSSGTRKLGPITDSDGRFDIDSQYLRYQLNANTGAYSADLYRVEWEYIVGSQTYQDVFHLEMRAVP